MRLLLARHAPTDWNRLGRYQGQTDIPLGDTGRQLASRLARRLAVERIDEVHTSDLRRARETAAALAEARRLPLHADPRLRELSFGAWEGLTRDQIERRDPKALTAWEADALRTAPPGGETLHQLADRVGAFLAELSAAARPERVVLVVAHNGPLQVLLCRVLGLPPEAGWKFRLEPASLSELSVYPEGAIVGFLNDTHHLREPVHGG
jgi:alpha-ribazole phosphatase